MQLSKKLKFLFEYFALFLKSTSSFELCLEKDDPHNSCLFKITNYERRG